MRPSVVLLGFLLGSSGSICFGLLGVAVVFWILAPDHPELSAEIGPLLAHLARFVILTVASAASFLGLLWRHPWRHLGVAILAVVLAGVVLSYTGL